MRVRAASVCVVTCLACSSSARDADARHDRVPATSESAANASTPAAGSHALASASPSADFEKSPTAVHVRGILRSSSSGFGLFCRPPVCAVPVDDPGYVVTVRLQPWRDASGAVHAEKWEGDVYAPGQEAWERLDRTFPKVGSAVEVVVDAPRTRAGYQGKLFHDFAIRNIEDAALASASPKPPVLQDRYFGSLQWRSQIGMYVGNPNVAGHPVEVLVDDGGDKAPDLARAQQRVTAIAGDLDRIQGDVAAKLIDTYNTSWRRGAPQAAAWLAVQMQLKSMRISTDEDDDIVYFDDGGAFGGHLLEVVIRGRRVVSANIAG